MISAEYNGNSGFYRIFSADGGHELLTGIAGSTEFHRLCDAIRLAERLSVKRERARLSELIIETCRNESR